MKTLLLSLMLGAALAPAAAQESVSHGRFKDVRLYRPKGEVKTVALLFSGANGWGAGGPGAAAQVLLDTGAVVAAEVHEADKGDTSTLHKTLEAARECLSRVALDTDLLD